VEIIVSFLAMLELVKQGVVHVTQQEDFGDIAIETHKFDTPEYA
jgi:chromatin segregation and condensation protein Rec8/ScpA/Scc1 (kleisin family)